MHHHNQNTNYKSYSYASRSTRNNYYQYYDPRIRHHKSLYSNSNPLLPQHYQPYTAINDLAEPLSVFDDLRYPSHRSSTNISLPSLYISSNQSRQSSISDARLAAASAMRERLFNDIQNNIREIDRDLTSLERRSPMLRFFPSHIPPTLRRLSRSKDDSLMATSKPKRAYQVVPRILPPPEPKQISPASTPSLIQQTTSYIYISQYHYAPEVEEIQIGENDPENIDRLSTAKEIPPASPYKTLSPKQFYRIQSAQAQNRALIFVPEYGDNSDTNMRETTDDFRPNSTKKINILQSSIIKISYPSPSANKLRIADFQSLIQTAPESQTEDDPTTIVELSQSDLDNTESDFANTILSKPTKYSRCATQSEEIHVSSQSEAHAADDTVHFFSDFGNVGEGEEDLISIDPDHFALPTEFEVTPFNDFLIRQSQTLLLNPHSTSDYLQQQLPIDNHNNQVKERESKKFHASTKHTVTTSTSTSPSKKTLPISIDDNTQAQLTRKTRHVNENQQEQSTTMSSAHQHSSSLRRASHSQSSTHLSRDKSITRSNIHQNHSDNNSSLPVLRHSTETTYVRPALSRSATPERRNSIPSIHQNVLLTAAEILDFHHSSLTDKQFESFSFNQQPSKSNESIQNQTYITDIPSTSKHRTLFTNAIQTVNKNPLQNWRERIDKALSKKHFPSNNKYSHIKSRVNTFDYFDYKPGKIIIPPERKSRPLTSKETSSKKRFGRLVRAPDGKPQIFNQVLRWNVQSKLKSYSLENIQYRPGRSKVKIYNQKPRWQSQSRLGHTIKKISRRQKLIPLEIISDEISQPTFDQSELKIFDINSSGISISKNEKLSWKKQSKIKDITRQNINYRPKKSTVRIFHQPTRWHSQSKLQITHSLTCDIQAKVKYWSEIDLHQLTKNKALFSQYQSIKWNDISNLSKEDLELETSLEKMAFDLRYSTVVLSQFRQINSPANRPKWNAVSKTRSLNSVYNPQVAHVNTIRRIWDFDLRRKRIQKLPPIKRRKRESDGTRQLAIQGPTSSEYSPNPHDRTLSILDNITTPSQRSSKALVPLPPLLDFRLLSETPRSQRPIQQEWYEDRSRSQLTYRTQLGHIRNNSFQDANELVHQTNTSRELLALRSSTQNSESSPISNTLLDTSIRTNRATELRLSKDMNEYHQHSHSPSQSVPIEIRGFRLEGSSLSVPDNATIRPLSNISYRSSERVKTRRIHPWNTLHSNGISSRNNSLVPISEFTHPSYDNSIMEDPKSIPE